MQFVIAEPTASISQRTIIFAGWLAEPASHAFALAMMRLSAYQRETLVMVVHGMSYEALAEATGGAVGTAKSRVFRGRRQLEAWLLGDVNPRGKGGFCAHTFRLLEAGPDEDGKLVAGRESY